MSKRIVTAVAFSILVGLAADVAAQASKQGKFRGTFGIKGAGQTHELEQGHQFFVGGFAGVFLNDTSGGFLDKTYVECPGSSDIVNGLEVLGQGYCIVTDKDGDKAFLAWKSRDTARGVGGGTFQWTAGTGKYAGIKGDSKYHYTGIGDTPAAVVTWEGEWRLP